MKRTALVLGVAFAAANLLPASALADGADKASVRHLRYIVSVGVQTRQDVTNYGGPTHSDTGQLTATGTIVADIVGVTPDNGLIVMLSENTDNRKAPPVKVTVLDQGQVTFETRDAANLNEEELALAALVGRAVVADHDLAPSYHWRLSRDLGHSSDSTTFHVLSLVGDNRVNLELDRVVKVTGAQPFDIAAHGKVFYDYKRSLPISGQISERVHSLANDPWEINARATTDISLEFRLAEDSLSQN
jgi:hypothetical protein